MSIWGKMVGGMAGMMVGGPLGAMMGASMGHMFYDRNPFRPLFNPFALMSGFIPGLQPLLDGAREQGRQSAFAMGVVILSAKVARAAGISEADGFAALARVASIADGDRDGVAALYGQAYGADRGAEAATATLKTLFEGAPDLLDEILEALALVAGAAGALEAAAATLDSVAEALGRPPRDWGRYRSGRSGAAVAADPWQVLGVSRDAAEVEIRAAYRRLLREFHPDTLMAQGLPEEFVTVANRRMAEINAAWDDIARLRGYRR